MEGSEAFGFYNCDIMMYTVDYDKKVLFRYFELNNIFKINTNHLI